jgi:transketolase
MNMRAQFVKTVEALLAADERLLVLLGDIGVWGFRNAFNLFPGRIYNIGILEQSTVSLASGLAMEGFIPVVHTIAPFLVERSIEQIKDDFCYQGLGGNFVSVGASYDYAALGCTHHCPADVGILKNLPGMEIVLPGTSGEFDLLFRAGYADHNPTYFRLSERENPESFAVSFGRAEVVKKGKLACVVAVGPMLAPVLEAAGDMDVTILYYTTVKPFDAQALRQNCTAEKILLVEPYYQGALAHDITESLPAKKIILKCLGVPLKFLTHYGKAEEHDEEIGLTAKNIRRQLKELINE